MDTYNTQRMIEELEKQRYIIEKETHKLGYVKTEKDVSNTNIRIQVKSPSGTEYIDEEFYFQCSDSDEREMLEEIRINFADIYKHRISNAKIKFDEIMKEIKKCREDEE